MAITLYNQVEQVPSHLARAGANTMLVDREGHGWPGAIRVVELELNLIRKMVGPPG